MEDLVRAERLEWQPDQILLEVLDWLEGQGRREGLDGRADQVRL